MKNLIEFEPVGRQFIIEMVTKNTTKSGLMLPGGVTPDMVEDDFKGLVVLAVGQDCTVVRPGQTVLLKPGTLQTRASGHVVKKNDKKVTLVSISEFDIFAVRHDVPVIDSYEYQSEEPWEKPTIVPVSDSDLTVIN